MNTDDLFSLKSFKYHKLLNEDPTAHTITLLGSVPAADDSQESLQTIVRLEKTPWADDTGNHLSDLIHHLQVVDRNGIYKWFLGCFVGTDEEKPDVKINVISPATEIHILKYTRQEVFMVHETPALYNEIVKPYIDSFPPSRTQWVEDILSGKSEADKILYNDEANDYGFVILPDMKWDLKTMASLYLVAIVRSKDIRSLRDLKRHHLGMLRKIKAEACQTVQRNWKLGEGSLRLFVHYQPSYYHFHVHIVNSNQSGLLGMTVGQAHLLDDIISLLELDVGDSPSVYEKISLNYGLGEHHSLYKAMRAASGNKIEL